MCLVPGRFLLKPSLKTKQMKKPPLVSHRPCSLIRAIYCDQIKTWAPSCSLHLIRHVCLLGKFLFPISWCLGKPLLNWRGKKGGVGGTKKRKVWIIARSHWPRWGGFLSLLKNRPRTKPDGSRLLALFNALPPTDGSPFALLPPPSFKHPPLGLSVLRLEIIFYCPVVRKWPFALD